MRRVTRFGCVVIALLVIGAWGALGTLSLSAQSKAKAENVPVIPYTSVPNFFKLPPTSTSAKASASPPIPRATCSSTPQRRHPPVRVRSERQLSSRSRAVGLYGLEFAHAVRVDEDDNVWVVDEGTNMVIKFNPEGRVVMVLGRRPEPVAGAFETTAAGQRRPRSTASGGRPTSRGTRRATSSSPTATSTRAS